MGFKTIFARGSSHHRRRLVGEDRAKEQAGAQSLDWWRACADPPSRSSWRARGPPDATSSRCHGVPIGGTQLVVMAGPCSVESRSRLSSWRRRGREGGRRPGAPRRRVSSRGTRPTASRARGGGLSSERGEQKRPACPSSRRSWSLTRWNWLAQHADIPPDRRAQRAEFLVLKRVADCGKPCSWKRGMSTSIQEWLLAARVRAGRGNPEVILCERGYPDIRDVPHAIHARISTQHPVIKKLSALPIPWIPRMHGPLGSKSQQWPRRAWRGADGRIIEVHNNPARRSRMGHSRQA